MTDTRPATAPVAASTLDAAEYLLKTGDANRFKTWLLEHSPAQRVTIIAHLKNKKPKP
jgi:hypothetical protein